MMRVFIKQMKPEGIEMTLDPEHTVSEVKRRIEEQEGVAVDQQRLIFAGQLMEDTKTLRSYSTKSECTMHLLVRLPILNVTVATPSGATLLLELMSSDTLDNVTSLIKDKHSVPPRFQRLFLGDTRITKDTTIGEQGIERDSELRLEFSSWWKCVSCLSCSRSSED